MKKEGSEQNKKNGRPTLILWMKTQAYPALELIMSLVEDALKHLVYHTLDNWAQLYVSPVL